ncbi:DNA mismatch repair protein MutT [Candidatus Uhrbacteria bacterium CG10_big_fil_rev_8_21_14_0_10_48_11]|uniref:DNA mismatch repair protein MutT n=1 Tax=Candidatus Uhrbacteria bacterium CG10_big_fil_rev_8_21_14_0_10_48_11 TaxID=1975037 RepID=A0A2M8LDU4_9BACT|nr:MAG: DNA mismatch repair protein MutT [Candidatus Uhrbacteria bacterium CG10_big_fil_rev_8_21_14_0_10_48_11]
MNEEVRQQFYVGVNVALFRGGKLLLGLRKNVAGAGTWGLPGGHLESKEKLVDAARRELSEETGLKPEKLTFINLTNNSQDEKHYLQIAFRADGVEGEAEICEPDCCSTWQWFSTSELPEDIFPPHAAHIAAIIAEEVYRES